MAVSAAQLLNKSCVCVILDLSDGNFWQYFSSVSGDVTANEILWIVFCGLPGIFGRRVIVPMDAVERQRRGQIGGGWFVVDNSIHSKFCYHLAFFVTVCIYLFHRSHYHSISRDLFRGHFLLYFNCLRRYFNHRERPVGDWSTFMLSDFCSIV